MIFIRKCKTCNKDVSYINRCSFLYAIRNNSDCKKCSALKRSPKSEETKKKISNTLTGRIIPKYVIDKRTITQKKLFNTPEYKEKLSILRSGKNNPNFGNHYSKEVREKISKITKERMKYPEVKEKIKKIHSSHEYRKKLSQSLKGRVFSEETKKKMKGPRPSLMGKNNPNFGKHRKHTAESKRKMRIALVKRLENIFKNYGIYSFPSFNPVACKIIDEYGKQNGYNFQHALNGGEYHIKELGYWVDGYDKMKNVIIEIDEPHHKTERCIKKDNYRQKEIEEYMKCKFIRLPFVKT